MKTLQIFDVKDPKAVVLVIHGSGEHIGRYIHIGKWLNQHQITMIGGDLPGLGKAEGIRGHIDDFNDYLFKVDEWLKYVKEKWPNKPLFLFGHSLGGLIVLRYIEEFENRKLLKGTIVSSPAVKLGITVPKWQLAVADVLGKIWPTFKMKSGIRSDQVSRDEEVVKRYGTDPLVYSKVTIRWFFEFQKAMEEVWESAEKIKGMELLYMQAGADQLVDPNASKEFVKKVNSDNVTFTFIPDLYHEILNEPEKEIYLKQMTEWVLNRV